MAAARQMHQGRRRWWVEGVRRQTARSLKEIENDSPPKEWGDQIGFLLDHLRARMTWCDGVLAEMTALDRVGRQGPPEAMPEAITLVDRLSDWRRVSGLAAGPPPENDEGALAGAPVTTSNTTPVPRSENRQKRISDQASLDTESLRASAFEQDCASDGDWFLTHSSRRYRARQDVAGQWWIIRRRPRLCLLRTRSPASLTNIPDTDHALMRAWVDSAMANLDPLERAEIVKQVRKLEKLR